MTFGQDSKDRTEFYIKKFRKELKEKDIDEFFIVKHIQYGVARLENVNDNDYCNKNQVHYRMFAFWKENNNYWLKVFDNCGGFVPIKLNNGKAWDFYKQSFEKIKVDEVERYKRKPDSIANGKKYSFNSSQSHSPLRYFWFYKSSNSFQKFIDKYDLTTSEKTPNISYETNINLAIVKLNDICDEIVEENVKTKSLVREK